VTKRASSGYRCGYCEYDMPSLTAHLRPGKERKRHNQYKQLCVEQVETLAARGWELHYEGITIKNMNYHCKPCGKTDNWYSVFDHIAQNKHLKAKAYCTDLPAKPAPTEEKVVALREAWTTAIREHRQKIVNDVFFSESSSSTAPSSGPAPSAAPTRAPAAKAPVPVPKASFAANASQNQRHAVRAATAAAASAAEAGSPARPSAVEAASKRQRVEERPSVGGAYTTAAASGSGSGRVKVPLGLEGQEIATRADIDDALQKAKQQWYPDLQEPLTFGKFIKKKGVCIWCTQCNAWVGWAQINYKKQPSELDIDPDGECAHYNPAYKRQYKNSYVAS